MATEVKKTEKPWQELILISFQNETNYVIMPVWQDRKGLM